MTMTASDALRSIPLTSMSKAELLALNEAVVAQIRTLQTTEAIRAGMQFRPGDKASFYSSKYGRNIAIKITKVNIKTVSAVELNDDGTVSYRTWKVAPTMLKACP